MTNKRISTYLAVAVAIGVVAFLLYGNVFVNLFNGTSSTTSEPQTNMATSTGVTIKDTVAGTGAVAEAGDTLTVNYVGTLPDGTVFDSSIARNQPFSFTLGAGQVIRGWDEGLVGMRVGGTRELTIAPDYAYGDQTVGPIPANSTLHFQVELLDVAQGGATAPATTGANQ